MRTLLIAPAWVGDMVMAEPLLRALHEADPGGTLHVAAPPATRALATRMAHVASVLDWPFAHGEFDLAGRMRLARAWRALGFDLVVVLPNSWKSALVPWLAGVPRRRGFVGEARWGLLNEARRLDENALPTLAQRFLSLAGAPGNVPAARAPRLASDVERARVLRAEHGLHGPEPVLALCIGAEYGPAKRWPATHFAALARTHVARGGRVWLLGTPKDSAAARAVLDALRAPERAAVHDLTGRTALLDAVDLLGECDAVVSNDSGLMHVAAALDRPVVGIYGSSSDAYTPPLGARARSIGIELSCRPCFARTCRFGHYACLAGVLPEQVVRVLDDLASAA